jgi:hypothetical protein
MEDILFLQAQALPSVLLMVSLTALDRTLLSIVSIQVHTVYSILHRLEYTVLGLDELGVSTGMPQFHRPPQ